MSVRHPDSVEKTLHQLQAVATADFEGAGKRYAAPANGTVLSDAFWRKYGCYLGCGGCCFVFTLDYLPHEYEAFAERYPMYASLGERRTVEVNGVGREIVTVHPQHNTPQRAHGKEWCGFLDLDTGACGVHDENPFSCQVELIKFRLVNDTGYVYKGPFGRAWNMRRAVDGEREILCDFSKLSTSQIVNNDIPVLLKMRRWATYFGIETCLDEILTAIDYALNTHSYKRAEIRRRVA